MKINLHSHTQYCDGKAPMEKMVLAAIEKGFTTYGISSHAPVTFENNFSIKDMEALKRYVKEFQHLRQQYANRISLLLSLEIDYIPGITYNFETFRKEAGLDYTIGAVHLVKTPTGKLWFIDGGRPEIYQAGLKNLFHNDIRKAVTTYYQQVNEMIETQKPDLVAHFDKIKMNNKGRFFSEEENWYRNLVEQTLEVIQQHQTVVEVNTRGLYKDRFADFFPGKWVLKRILEKNIPVSLNTDAHHPDEIDGYYREGIQMLRETGFEHLTYFQEGEWKKLDIALFE